MTGTVAPPSAASRTIADPSTSIPRPRASVTSDGDRLIRLGTIVAIRPPQALPLVEAVLGNREKLLPLGRLATEIGADVGDLVNLCQQLNNAGFLWLAPPAGSVPLDEFKQEFRFWVRHWVRRMFSDPVWEGVRTGSASPTVLVGWVKENMHYTGSVIRHMTRAAAHAEDRAEGWTLLTHNSQEWDHYALFRGACASVGLDPAELSVSRPLPGTVAITHLMRRLARRHPLVYNACEAMLEATAERPERVVEFFETARATYGYPRAFIDPLIEHLHVDEEFEHIDIFDGLVAHLDTVPFDLLSEIMAACQELADTMYAWHAQIASYYGGLCTIPEVLTSR